MEKSDRLREALQNADTFKPIMNKLAGLAGISSVGDTGNSQLKALAKEEKDREEIDSLLGSHAQTLLNMIENVEKIDSRLEEDLLARNTLSAPLAPTTQQSDDDDSSFDSMYLGVSPASFGEEKKDDKDICRPGAKLPWTKSTKGQKHGLAGFPSFFGPPPDALNLQGLLNVLDGVVDSPGRIIIMTTNHPEALDPALIRPGRVDKKLLLGYMAAQDVTEMLEHYYQTALGPMQRRRIECAVVPEKFGRPGLRLVPAQLEQMTAEFDSVDALIEALEAKANPAWRPLGGGEYAG